MFAPVNNSDVAADDQIVFQSPNGLLRPAKALGEFGVTEAWIAHNLEPELQMRKRQAVIDRWRDVREIRREIIRS